MATGCLPVNRGRTGARVMSKLVHQAIDSLLKKTSRSFYLTLKALPPRIRPQIGLGYLLARIADTVADAKGGPTNQRLHLLGQFNDRIQGHTGTVPNLTTLARLKREPAETQLRADQVAVIARLYRGRSRVDVTKLHGGNG